ncbi:hypothetical protein BC832DRAFT_592477 [Gaertneriomyces semiglobifer]|nr:hypothetical protein BC832DRAFT_592477 [Gaertneriomyces semiglobifer]
MPRVCLKAISTRLREQEPVYVGPQAKTASLLKKVSATTFGVSVGLVPVLTMLENVNWVILGTMMGAAITMSGASTGLVTWAVNPYVTRLFIPRSTDGSTEKKIGVFETINFFGRPRYTAVHLDDLVRVDGHFATLTLAEGAKTSDDGVPELVEAVGKRKWGFSRRKFYVHPELDEGFSAQMESMMKTIK